MALSLSDGRPIWQEDRRGVRDLAGIDGTRVLISGTDHYPRVVPYTGPLTRPADFLAATQAATRPAPGRPGFYVIDASTGKPLYAAPDDCPVMAAPAVTRTRAILPGRGTIYCLDLADYSLRRVEIKDAVIPLGNLFTWRGAIFSAGPAGVTAFSPK